MREKKREKKGALVSSKRTNGVRIEGDVGKTERRGNTFKMTTGNQVKNKTPLQNSRNNPRSDL
jgi:hypothetical protein